MITLDYADKRPLYEQIREKTRELIITGVLPEHSRIPSVRELASALAINPNTIQKAYRELEKEGYIYSVSAKGSYVSPLQDRQNAGLERKAELSENLLSVVTEMKLLGASKEEIYKVISEIFEGEEIK